MKGRTIIIIITTIIIIITSIMGTIQSVPSPLGCLSSGIESYHTRTLLFHLYVDDKEHVPQKLKDTNDNICKSGWLKGIKLLTSFLFLENHSESIKQWYILSFPSKWVLKSVIQNSRNGLGVKVRLYKRMQTQAGLLFLHRACVLNKKIQAFWIISCNIHIDKNKYIGHHLRKRNLCRGGMVVQLLAK